MHKLLPLGLLALIVAGCQPGETTEEETAEQAVEGQQAHETAPVAAPANGSVIEGDHYRITTDITGAGLDKRMIATVEPTNGFHVNHDYPWALNFLAGTSIIGGPTYRAEQAAEFSDTLVRFEIVPSNDATGDITGNLRFGVCSDDGDVCENPREDITWSLD